MLKLLFFPFVFVWGIIGFFFGILGRLFTMVLGLIFMLVGTILALSLVGLFVGIPLVLLGFGFLMRSLF